MSWLMQLLFLAVGDCSPECSFHVWHLVLVSHFCIGATWPFHTMCTFQICRRCHILMCFVWAWIEFNCTLLLYHTLTVPKWSDNLALIRLDCTQSSIPVLVSVRRHAHLLVYIIMAICTFTLNLFSGLWGSFCGRCRYKPTQLLPVHRPP